MAGTLQTRRENWLPEKAATLPAWKIAMAQRMRGLTVAQHLDAVGSALAMLTEIRRGDLSPAQWAKINQARTLVVDAMMEPPELPAPVFPPS